MWASVLELMLMFLDCSRGRYRDAVLLVTSDRIKCKLTLVDIFRVVSVFISNRKVKIITPAI